MVLEYILLATIGVSLISLIGVVLLSLKQKLLEKILLFVVAFAAGALIAAAFLDLMPEAVELVGTASFGAVIWGLVAFFIVEKFLHWEHCHKGRKCDVHVFTYICLVGDAVHNFIDGAVIAASFLISVPLGMITTLAVVLHEIPQELGDFSILIYGGFSKAKALFWNFISALTAIAGALLIYFLGISPDRFAGWVVAFAAGGFIYLATADLIPELHKKAGAMESVLQFMSLGVGMVLIWALTLFMKA
jgi:zinc and cadmium transporter